MAKKIIVLDPGHGGKDPGAVGNDLLEKEITLMVARKVAKRLGNYDVTVRLTRDDDTFLSLDTRATFANNLRADYFLSIHVNAGGGTGFESFIYNGPVNSVTGNLRTALHQTITTFVKSYGIVDRGEKKANFAVLRQTNMPACLIEILFIDTAKDAAFLKDDEFMRGMSDAITAGLVRILNLAAVTPEPQPEPTQPSTPVWNPQGEIQKLIDAGVIFNNHPVDAPVTWGEFAAVINRLLNSNKQ